MNMKIEVKRDTITKLAIYCVLTALIMVLYKTNQVVPLATFALAISVVFLIKSSSDIMLYMIAFVIFYANYSITIGEYLVKNLQLRFTGLRDSRYDLFVLCLALLTIFTLWLSGFIKANKKNYVFPRQKNDFAFVILYIFVIVINIVFFDWRTISSSYVVRSTPLVGYSYLFFIFLHYFDNNETIKKVLTIFLAAVISVIGLFFGQRHNILCILIIELLCNYSERLNFKKINIVIFAGVVVLSYVGAIRDRRGIAFLNFTEILRSNLLVQDTSVYAFNSSITHLYMLEKVGKRFLHFVAFLLSIFIGGSSQFTSSNELTVEARKYAYNAGGGFIFTNFYYFMGILGVIFIALLICYLYNRLRNPKGDLSSLILICLVASTSHWYIYSPLSLFRGPFVLTAFIYIVFTKVFSY